MYNYSGVVTETLVFGRGFSRTARTISVATSADGGGAYDESDETDQSGDIVQLEHGLASPGIDYSPEDLGEGNNPEASLSVASQGTVTDVVVMGRREISPTTRKRSFRPSTLLEDMAAKLNFMNTRNRPRGQRGQRGQRWKRGQRGQRELACRNCTSLSQKATQSLKRIRDCFGGHLWGNIEHVVVHAATDVARNRTFGK